MKRKGVMIQDSGVRSQELGKQGTGDREQERTEARIQELGGELPIPTAPGLAHSARCLPHTPHPTSAAQRRVGERPIKKGDIAKEL
jgi:hypothetical protein